MQIEVDAVKALRGQIVLSDVKIDAAAVAEHQLVRQRSELGQQRPFAAGFQQRLLLLGGELRIIVPVESCGVQCAV